MEQPPSIVNLAICSYLSAKEIDTLGKLNRPWFNFICEHRHLFPKKLISLSMERKTQSSEKTFEFFDKQVYRIPSVLREEVHLLFRQHQQGAGRYYGVVLKQFIPRQHNVYKTADSFDIDDINQLALDTDYSPEVKYVENIDDCLLPLMANICSKVDLEHLVLEDPTPSQLSQLALTFRCLRTTVRKISLKFKQTEIPAELVQLLTSIRACRVIEITADRSSALPPTVLDVDTVQNAQTLEFQLGHFSAMQRRPSSNSLVSMDTDENDDDSLCNLKAETMKVRGIRLTSNGANRIIKQWISGERGSLNSPIVYNITIDSSKFRKEDILRDVVYEERGRLRDSFTVSRKVFGKIEKATVTWYSGRFSFEANAYDELETQGYRLWF